MRWPTSFDLSTLWSREFRIELRPLLRRVRQRPEAAIVGVGIALRVITYLGAAYFPDEWEPDDLHRNSKHKGTLLSTQAHLSRQVEPFTTNLRRMRPCHE